MNKSNRYIFVVNFEQVDARGNKVKNEVTVKRGSINNQWFLMADYVIDSVKKVVLKNRYGLIDNKNVLLSYS